MDVESYIAAEHKELIEKAEAQLREYEQALLARLQARCECAGAIRPHPEEVKRAQEEFETDPFRRALMRLIVDTRLLFERPRFIVRKP